MKSTRGNFFEDFSVGQVIQHATPRTINAGDFALYTALYGSRFAVQSSDEFARAIGYPRAPVDDLLVFHIVLGKSVPDISLNAIANLGYAECRFHAPVFLGDTLSARSEVIGLRQASSGEAGIVYVRTSGVRQDGALVLDYVRWVMVGKRNKDSRAPEAVVPKPAARVDPATLGTGVPVIPPAAWNARAAGSPWFFSDYGAGERIDHIDGVTLEEAEHQLATRLYQNNARVHFDARVQAHGRLGRRLVYGGVVMSIARALSFNGLGSAFHIAAINGGRHAAPCVAGDTVYAGTEILECAGIPGRTDIGAVRTVLTAFARRHGGPGATVSAIGAAEPDVLLELDMWLILPRR